MLPATFMNARPYGPAVNGSLTMGGHPDRYSPVESGLRAWVLSKNPPVQKTPVLRPRLTR
jgi:hypothetical protein